MKKSTSNQNITSILALVSICFIFSGASSLALEVTWSKYLSLLLGGTIYGVATVVAAFMAGLGLGSFLAGRISSRLNNHIRVYGWLEAAVGFFALASPLLFTHIDLFFKILYGLIYHSFALFLFIRFIVLFIILMVPTFAMGASLPILVEYFARKDPLSHGRIGFLYAINTVGAVLGTATAGFYLIPKLGLARTAIAAAIIDIAIFLFILVKKFPAAEGEREIYEEPIAQKKAEAAAAKAVPGQRQQYWKGLLVAILFGISGFLAMAYQIGWTRVLIIPLGSSVYCFTIILVLYLAGLSLGAGATSRLAEKTSSPLAWFGFLEGLIAASTYLGSYWFGELSSATAWAFNSSRGNPFSFFFNETLIAAPIVLPPTLIMGALFPIAARAYRDFTGKTGRAVGTIYAANTLGTIMGSLGAGFIIIPMVGARSMILAAVVASAFIGAAAIIIASGGLRLKIAALALAILACCGAVFFQPIVRRADLTHGFVSILRKERDAMTGQVSSPYPGEHETGTAPQIPRLERIIFYREGLNATVAVGTNQSDRYLVINGKADASTMQTDMVTQSMLGHLPMFFYPEASDLLIIGLGAGVTTHAVLTYPAVRRVDTVEIETAVAEASIYFRDVNHDVLQDPRHHLILEDARTWLSYSDQTYDVIVSEPSNPWIAGINNLFTREFYRKVEAKLRPGGIFCQWIQAYDIKENSFCAILRSLNYVFSDAHIFYGTDFGDIFIIVRKPPLRKPAPEKAFANPAVANDVASIGIDNPAALGLFYKTSIPHFLEGHKKEIYNTDDNGYLEHQAPFDLIDSKMRSFPFVMRKSFFEDYHALFYPERPMEQILIDAGRAAARLGDLNYALWVFEICKDRGFFGAAAALQPEIENARDKKKIQEQLRIHTMKADELQEQGKLKEALEELKKAGALDPNDNYPLSKAAMLLMDLNQPKLAEQMFQELIKRRDRKYLYMAHVELGILLGMRKVPQESLGEFTQAISVNPYLAPAYYFGSHALESQGRLGEAIEMIRTGLRYGPDDPILLDRLASLLEKTGNLSEARRCRSLAKRYQK